MICNDCPRKCNIDRKTQVGFCGFKDKIVVAKVIENFMWEEPCISGAKGSLAIFFAGCNLKCNFCQNYKISFSTNGNEFTPKQFCEFLEKFDQEKYSCIELISATQFSSLLIESLAHFNKKIPIVWNSGGYEKAQTIELLSEIVDVFMPDLKFYSTSLSKTIAKAENYFEFAGQAIIKMRQCKEKEVFQGKQLISGLLIRHLVIPQNSSDSIKLLDFIAKNITSPFISLMCQFTPTENSVIKRKIYPLEYKIVLSHAQKLGLTRGYIQDFSSADESFIPSF